MPGFWVSYILYSSIFVVISQPQLWRNTNTVRVFIAKCFSQPQHGGNKAFSC